MRFDRAGVGTNGSTQKLYYCEVTDDDKSADHDGGGVDDEIIDVVELTLDECRDMVKQGATNNAPPSCLLGKIAIKFMNFEYKIPTLCSFYCYTGISWFFANKISQ